MLIVEATWRKSSSWLMAVDDIRIDVLEDERGMWDGGLRPVLVSFFAYTSLWPCFCLWGFNVVICRHRDALWGLGFSFWFVEEGICTAGLVAYVSMLEVKWFVYFLSCRRSCGSCWGLFVSLGFSFWFQGRCGWAGGFWRFEVLGFSFLVKKPHIDRSRSAVHMIMPQGVRRKLKWNGVRTQTQIIIS